MLKEYKKWYLPLGNVIYIVANFKLHCKSYYSIYTALYTAPCGLSMNQSKDKLLNWLKVAKPSVKWLPNLESVIQVSIGFVLAFQKLILGLPEVEKANYLAGTRLHVLVW
jgi:hypothetical protein